MKQILRSKWPLAAVSLILLCTMIYVIDISLRQNDGNIIYALDDAYIHMAMAKNFITHNVWGITQHEFTSSSSSIIWPLLISFFFLIFGVNENILLILNIIISIGLLYVCMRILAYYKVKPLIQGAILLLVLFLAPLPALIVSGMEHILQMITYVTALYLAAKLFANEVSTEDIKRYKLMLLFTLLIATFTRYEALSMAGVIALIFLFRKDYMYALSIMLIPAVPILVFGLISLYNGWFFLPNSVILKGIHPTESLKDLLDLLYNRYEILEHNMHFVFYLVISPALLGIYYAIKKKADSLTYMMLLNVMLLVIHALAFRYNWFFRYEAYLVVTTILINSIALVKILRSSKVWHSAGREKYIRIAGNIVMAVVILFYFFKTHEERAVLGTQWSPTAMNDRYIEHVWTAKFLKEYYNTSTVVLNDVGTTGFYTNARILDIYGLASFAPAKFAPYLFTSRTDVYREKTSPYRQEFDKWIRSENGQIAILQTGGWYIKSFIPSEWEKIGMWEIPSNVVFGDKEVSFFCINPAERERMIRSLKEFSAKIPNNVIQTGAYTEYAQKKSEGFFNLTSGNRKSLLKPQIYF